MAKPIDLKNLIEKFLKDTTVMNSDRIYNEFSLQFELGFFLRDKLKNKGFKVQFERNVAFFNGNKKKFIKKEMDLVIFNNNKSEKYAIELKFPTNKTPSKRMPHFLEDVVFMENVKDKLDFERTYCLTLVPNDVVATFLKRQKKDDGKIYEYFRGDFSNDSVVLAKKNIGKSCKKINQKFKITREFKPIQWRKTDFCRYYLLVIPDSEEK